MFDWVLDKPLSKPQFSFPIGECTEAVACSCSVKKLILKSFTEFRGKHLRSKETFFFRKNSVTGGS